MSYLTAEAAGKSTDELKAELARLLGFTAENLMRLAVVVRELESRGEDLSSIKLGLLPILRKIASGQLLPEIVVMYAGQPAAIKKIAEMPLPEQESIAKRERVVDVSQWSQRRAKQPETNPQTDIGEGENTIKGIAQKATAKDVGEMAAKLLVECDDWKAAMTQFVAVLIAEDVVPLEFAELPRRVNKKPKKRTWSFQDDD